MEKSFASSTVLLLIFGVILTIITIRRMLTGRITLPGWAKVLLIAGMLLSQLILLVSILPPISVDSIFIHEETTPVVSISPDEDQAAP